MGYAHIFYLYDDALLRNADPEAIACNLGAAVIALARQQSEPLHWQRVGVSENGLHLCDQVHSAETRIYLWTSNCLRELGQIDARDLAHIRELLDREEARRAATRRI